MSDDWRGPNASLIGQPGSRAALGTPALVLDLDRLDANIHSMAVHAKLRGYEIRAVAKIHKSVEIARRQVAAGAVGVCCATLAEAETMVAGGIPGVMLFSTVVSEPKLQRLAALNARAGDIIVVTDDSDNIIQLGRVVRPTGRTLQVMVDFDLGGGRTGVVEEGSALSLNRVSQLLARFEAEGLHPRIVSGGGTGSHDIDTETSVFTEIQAGTYVFMDLYYLDAVMRREEGHPFQPSLTVRGSVISAAQPGFVTTDVGLKEVDGAYTEMPPQLVSGAPEGASYSLQGDDLGRIDFAHDDDHLPVGAAFEVIPPHCYQTAAFYSVYHCVSGDKLVDIWPVDALKSW